jgi:hypothetical protein
MTSEAVSSRTKIKKVWRSLSPEQAAAAVMVAQAREQGLALTGPDGLLKLYTKSLLETALNEEMTEHLGYEKYDAGSDRESANIRNGCRPKTVISDAVGEVEIAVGRNRQGTFTPAIVKKRQRRLADVDEMVLSLYAKGLTTGEISAHFRDIYGASVSKETVSRITDKVACGDEGLVWSSIGFGVCGDVHRCDCGEGARGPGGQLAGVRGHRGHPGGPQGRAGTDDGYRWR